MKDKNTKAAEEQSKPTTAVSTFVDYGQDAGAGYENQRREDLVIPFVHILQPLSQAVQDNEALRPGQFYNNVTEESSSELYVVPALVQHCFVEWKQRKDGGGFVGIHQLDSDFVKQCRELSGGGNKIFTQKPNDKNEPQGNQLVETYYLYCLTLEKGTNESNGMVVVPFKSTNIRQYRKWNTKVNMFTMRTSDGRKVRPPLFAHKLKLSTIKEENQEGTWYNYQIDSAQGDIKSSLIPPGSELLEEAKSLREMVESGAARAAHEHEGAAEPAADGGTSANPKGNRPF